jgi:ABC-type bacteriocin/lantibiotic exporter with double-glycine peptidase domain
MKKYYIELQDEPKACGAYCIYMILRYHGVHVELKSIKERSRMDNNGISMKGMLECLKEYQVEAKAYHASLNDIKENVTLPCILHFTYEDLGHYVVLYEIKDDLYIIGDPAKGMVQLYEDEVEEHYSKMMISIQHIGRNSDEKEESYLHFLINNYKSYKHEVIKFFFKGLMISSLSFISSFVFQIIIDYINNKTAYFYMLVICFIYFISEISKIYATKNQSLELLELKKVLDEDYVLSTILKMIHFPMSFYQQEKGIIHNQLLSLYQLSEMSIILFENILLNGITIIIFFIAMLFIDYILAIIILVMLFILAIYMKSQVNVVRTMSQEYLEKYSIHHHALLEYIENIFELKRFKVTERINDYQDSYIDESLKRLEKEQKIVKINSNVSFIIQIFYTIVLIIGLWFYHHSVITIGKFIMFYMLLSALVPNFISIISLFFDYHQMKLIYERYKNFQIEPKQLDQIKEPIQQIRFDNVSFAFGYREPLFNHIDLTINKHLYIKGNSGSGKSTLLKLIMGFNYNYSGDIYINDQELRTIDLNSLYDHIGYECQTPTFFHKSLYDNFLCDDAEKIKKLLKSFGYSYLEDMFFMTLNEDGSPLSQGQKQVVALVRLFLRDYDVYILDEVFANMDNKSAGRIYRYIIKNYSDKILIMVNHQTKLVNRNDDYVIIENGKIKKKDD